jgi:RimJ/RimL family protein N-acetyltransferase
MVVARLGPSVTPTRMRSVPCFHKADPRNRGPSPGTKLKGIETSASRSPAPPVGASGRRLRRWLGPQVESVGPPPPPVLAPPWAVVAVEPTGPEFDRLVGWMREPHVAVFWRQAWSRSEWAAELVRQLEDDHSRPWTVWHHDQPVAYLEIYRAARDVLADHYPVAPHDLGIHIAIGDRDQTGRRLGTTVLRLAADGLLAADARCESVLGDPDAAHHVARRAVAAAGFALTAEVDLPHKRAAIYVRRRAAGTASRS